MQRQARRYQRIDDSDYPSDHDPRFDVPAHLNPKLRKPTTKTIVLAFGLLFVGSVLLTCYALYATGKGGIYWYRMRAQCAAYSVRRFPSSFPPPPPPSFASSSACARACVRLCRTRRAQLCFFCFFFSLIPPSHRSHTARNPPKTHPLNDTKKRR